MDIDNLGMDFTALSTIFYVSLANRMAKVGENPELQAKSGLPS